jgi:hypothetical protein
MAMRKRQESIYCQFYLYKLMMRVFQAPVCVIASLGDVDVLPWLAAAALTASSCSLGSCDCPTIWHVQRLTYFMFSDMTPCALC